MVSTLFSCFCQEEQPDHGQYSVLLYLHQEEQAYHGQYSVLLYLPRGAG